LINRYGSDQFTLEIIFHNHMMRYHCLTDNPAEAAAIYVPYYAALDIGRHLWNQTMEVRDALMNEMLQWLRSSPEWAVRGGQDHFIVVGRTTWDMRRKKDENSYWGGKFMLVPETKSMMVLIVEALIEDSSTTYNNEFGIPFPTYFHPSKMSDIITWKDKIRHVTRPHLFSFIGARRKNHSASAIRDQVIEQCLESPQCKLLECGAYGGKCRSPVGVMSLFQNSIFCMQPPGDSYTRRSTFDSMLAGCIPVFFHHKTAHEQYKWYLPRDYTKYSVYIPEDAVRNGTVKIEDVLVAYSAEQIKAMREEIINMIPKFVYTDPRYNVEGIRDAFDIAVDSVIERTRGIRDESG
jgi:xyloglucan galactosyltransferase MUR3